MTSNQATLWDVPSTPLQASEAGPTLSGSQDGPTIYPCGRDRAHANLSARQAREKGLLTSGTYGPHSAGLSSSAALQSSLESRLVERTALSGSPLYRLTWKRLVMPSLRSVLVQRVSGLRTKEKGCTGWPTPNAGPQNDSDSTWRERRELLKEKHGNGNGFGMNLGMASTLAGWATPRKSDESTRRMSDAWDGHDIVCQAQLAGWPTPMAGTPAQNGNSEAGNTDSSRLTVSLTPGPASNGLNAPTESAAPLNACLSRWLMGFPPEWDYAAIEAHRCFGRQRKGKRQGQ